MKRREFLGAGAMLAAGLNAEMPALTAGGSLTDVEGVKVGHFTDTRRPTGCTVVMTEEGAVAGVDVRGGAPGTRETDLLNPVNTVSQVNAVLLAGGSAFGLAAADGVVRYLEEKGFGYQAGTVRVPIVPAAIIFDLQVGDSSIRPTAESGYKACQAARGGSNAAIEQGNVGAGAGATIGKLLGRERAMKGGVGMASLRLPDGLVVAALVAVNAVGDVYDPATGKLLAGARTADGKRLADVMALIRKGELPPLPADQRRGHTTIGVVATNAALNKSEATKVAQMAHDGLARSIRPVHTPSDGDTIFALTTGRLKPQPGRTQLGAPLNLTVIGALAAEVMAAAVVSAVLRAKSIPGYPSYSELQKR
jgi:L-aminopeptidase/D-esterase-like protein